MNAPQRAARKSFGEYLVQSPTQRPRGQPLGFVNVDEEITTEFYRRLSLSAPDIHTLDKLQRWTKERWPRWWTREGTERDDGSGEWRDVTPLKRCCEDIWAAYLRWAEAEE